MSDFLSNFEKANKNAKRLTNKILIEGKLTVSYTHLTLRTTPYV